MTFGDLTSFHQNKIFALVCFTRGAWPAFHEIGNSKATLLKWPKMGFSRNNRFFRVQLLLILMVKCSVILPNFEVKFSFPLFFSTKYQSRQKILKWLIREAPDHLKLIGRIRHRHCKLQIWLELYWRKKKNQIIPKVHILSKNSIFCDFSIKTHFEANG